MGAFFESLWRPLAAWYRRHYLATLIVTTALFLLQLFHLYWLFTDVILKRITGHSYFIFPPQGLLIYVLIDYFEIPTHLSAMGLYFYEFRQGIKMKSLFFFFLLQLHWVHLLWITDDVVVNTIADHPLLAWGSLAAWIAILIDYLEVPIIVDRLHQVWQERRVILHRIRVNLGRHEPEPAATAVSRLAA
jgi:hypothetical protein